jgi:hypothetical protein
MLPTDGWHFERDELVIVWVILRRLLRRKDIAMDQARVQQKFVEGPAKEKSVRWRRVPFAAGFGNFFQVEWPRRVNQASQKSRNR